MIRAKGVDRSIIVSDASPIAGMPPGEYRTLGNYAVLEPSGYLHNPAKQCLVGSSAMMIQCMNHLASLKFLSLDDLIKVSFINPLKLIGVKPASIPASHHLKFRNGRFEV
jgi:N-acetylglucosamine-6-phosphate deacetylase